MNAYYLPGEQLGWIPGSLAGLLASASVYKSSFGKKWNETFHQSCFKRDVRFFLLGFINTPTSCLLISIQFNATNRPTELRCLSLLILYSLLNRLIRRNNGFGEQASYGDELIAFFVQSFEPLGFAFHSSVLKWNGMRTLTRMGFIQRAELSCNQNLTGRKETCSSRLSWINFAESAL